MVKFQPLLLPPWLLMPFKEVQQLLFHLLLIGKLEIGLQSHQQELIQMKLIKFKSLKYQVQVFHLHNHWDIITKESQLAIVLTPEPKFFIWVETLKSLQVLNGAVEYWSMPSLTLFWEEVMFNYMELNSLIVVKLIQNLQDWIFNMHSEEILLQIVTSLVHLSMIVMDTFSKLFNLKTLIYREMCSLMDRKH